jgi:hypothetical protein
MQKLGPFLNLLFYFDPKKLFDNNKGMKVTSIYPGNLCLCVCVCTYTYIYTHTHFSAEEKFMTQVTMDRLKVTSPKLFVASNQVQFLHLLSFLISIRSTTLII